jgi:2-polyprenyl-3-methyl-5-hydroxy-6-metoxy-1,4-benzoquinol methylase
MKAATQGVRDKLQISLTDAAQKPVSKTPLVCPACGHVASGVVIERFGRYECFACGSCDLHFWNPREMPHARWYECVYRGRNVKLLPLEPGHKYFLTDPAAPRGGKLLDVGCGTGNFLAAARNAGYDVSGTELDRDAARFAKDQVGLPRIFPLAILEFVQQHPDKTFDVVTFFEVLEHQATPAAFLEGVRCCVRSRGYIALSVPNRERWLTAPDVLDYPPNHFFRWSVKSLKSFLSAHGFEIVSVREQPAGLTHTAQMINMSFRTGLSRSFGGQGAPSFQELIQREAEQVSANVQPKPTARQRTMQILGRIKYAACFPAAVAVYPYIRARGRKGTYLYCLARRKD